MASSLEKNFFRLCLRIKALDFQVPLPRLTKCNRLMATFHCHPFKIAIKPALFFIKERIIEEEIFGTSS
jgi:hypothetical protein